MDKVTSDFKKTPGIYKGGCSSQLMLFATIPTDSFGFEGKRAAKFAKKQRQGDIPKRKTDKNGSYLKDW